MASNLESAAAKQQAASIARYRLSLVREDSPPYNTLRHCDHPEKAACFLHDQLGDTYQEVVGGLLLDARHRAIGYHIAYRGTLTRAAVEPRGLLVPALLANAAGFVAFHTHPSGDPTPSAADHSLTYRLSKASEIVGVHLLDHIILGEAPAYRSLRADGRLGVR